MQPVLNVEDVRNVEEALTKAGVSLSELMRRAGSAAAQEVERLEDVSSVVILAAALIRILPKAQDSDNNLRPRCPRALSTRCPRARTFQKDGIKRRFLCKYPRIYPHNTNINSSSGQICALSCCFSWWR